MNKNTKRRLSKIAAVAKSIIADADSQGSIKEMRELALDIIALATQSDEWVDSYTIIENVSVEIPPRDLPPLPPLSPAARSWEKQIRKALPRVRTA